MLQVFNLVAPLFGLIILGFIAGKIARLPLTGLAWMNFFIIYIALPAMIFHLLAKTPVTSFANLKFVVLTTLATLLIFIVGYLFAISRATGKVKQATIQGFGAAYGNIGYLGPPLAIAAFGPGAIVPAAMIFSFDNTLHFSLAPTLMTLGEGTKHSRLKLLAKIIRAILTHPFILATIAGLTAAAFSYEPPSAIDKALATLAAAAAPCALFTMGVTAALRPLKNVPIELTWLVPLKLIVHPALVYGLLMYFGPFSQVIFNTAVLMAALPAATNVFVLAQQYDIWQERASSLVIISTLVSMLTVPMLLYFLG